MPAPPGVSGGVTGLVGDDPTAYLQRDRVFMNAITMHAMNKTKCVQQKAELRLCSNVHTCAGMACACAGLCVCVCTHVLEICAQVCARAYVCMSMCVHTCFSVCPRLCAYTCVCMCVCARTCH